MTGRADRERRVLIAVFALGGLTKVAGVPPMPTVFARTYRYPLWFMRFTGVAELVTAVSLAYPRTYAAGGFATLVVMAGAVATNLRRVRLVPFVAFNVVVGRLGWRVCQTALANSPDGVVAAAHVEETQG